MTSGKHTERDYVLGTHDAEIERLGLQHRVWRRNVLDAWQRHGIQSGHTVIDLGAGPGYATRDLADIVGPTGKVVAIERSHRFLDALEHHAQQNQLQQIRPIEADLVTDAWEKQITDFSPDFSWARWVLAFVSDPQCVLKKLHTVLKPNGIAIFHEYIDYGSWRMLPAVPEQEAFVDLVIKNWRGSGGEPDIGRDLPKMLEETGFELLDLKPLVFVVSPNDPMWQWPVSFIEINIQHMVDHQHLDPAEAEKMRTAIMKAIHDGRHFFVTPMVLEIAARKK